MHVANRSTAEQKTRLHGLYAIADTTVLDAAVLVHAVECAIAGGAAVIQYRDKSRDAQRRRGQARALAALCHANDVPLIIDDDPVLATEARADGVHLGQGDPGLKKARALLGAEGIIGLSCYNDLDRAVIAQAGGADYVAFGSFFPSPTKPGAVHADPELLRRGKQRLRIPVIAIGGITPENGDSLIAAGADALAVISGVFGQPDIRAAAKRYARLFDRN